MTGEMRFSESHKAGDAAFAVEFMPDGTDRPKSEIGDYAIQNTANDRFIAQCGSFTACGFDQPFGPNYHRGKTNCFRVISGTTGNVRYTCK